MGEKSWRFPGDESPFLQESGLDRKRFWASVKFKKLTKTPSRKNPRKISEIDSLSVGYLSIR
jgi:hypothetical protein